MRGNISLVGGLKTGNQKKPRGRPREHLRWRLGLSRQNCTMQKDTYSAIVGQVRKFTAKWRALLVWEGVTYIFAFIAASVLFSFVSDNMFHFSPLLRGLILLLFLLTFLFVLYARVLRRLLMRITPERAAVYIESRLGQFDNRLINALQLGRGGAYLKNEIINALVSEAGTELQRRSLRKSLDLRQVKKWSAVLGAAALVLLVYFLSFGRYFQNAFARFSNLSDAPLPITRINLKVSPGDAAAFVGDDLEIAARSIRGPLPQAAHVVHVSQKKSTARMEFNGESFQYSFHNLQHGFRYRVVSEDFKSRWYQVIVEEPLRVERIEMTLSFPDYLRISSPVLVPSVESEVHVLEGTKAELRFFTNREVETGHLLIGDVKEPLTRRSPTELSAERVIADDLVYRVQVKTAKAASTTESLVRKIFCHKDVSPAAELLEPKSDYSGAGEEPLTLIAKAADDVAISSVKVILEAPQTDGPPKPIPLGEWTYNSGSSDSIDSLQRMAIETVKVRLLDHLQTGQSAFVYVTATDMKGSTSSSSKTRVSLIAPEQRSELEQAEKESIFRTLREILEAQTRARSSVDQSSQPQDEKFRSARDEQVGVHSQTLSLIDRLNLATQLDYGEVKTVLLGLSTNEMVDVVKQMNAISPETFSQGKPSILGVQDEIVRRLQELLGQFAREEEAQPEKEPLSATEKPLDEALSKLKELSTVLKNFIEEQRKVITSSLELQSKKPEDFTQQDEELKRKLQIVEDQWAKFLEEKSTELDKIPEQDFSKPTLLKELRQIYEEIEVAADELSKPGTRIPVTEEQVGLELAEKLEHNLESWLPNESDKFKWELEEPSTPPDVPMAELPEELEDIVGDLIRDEQSLDPEMEDMSSSWVDSIDAGAGWDTMDGPISNMSAKGKTGNTLPNASEISGRSAEGRSGKSNGEFVSDTAIGKGGRRTPTRVMNDPYESATIDDRMTEPTGGATGGGKRSGAGGEGLRGHIPPDLQTKLADLRGQQADLITRGERLMHTFDKLNINPQKLDEVLQKMKQLDENMGRFKYTDLVAAHEKIVEGLGSAQDIVSHDWKIRRELNARLPTKIRKTLDDTLNTEFPRDYEALLREYYKAISE